MSDTKCGIYQIRNLKDNKIYIGSAQNLDKRWKCHLWQLRNKRHHNFYLQEAYNTYGEDSFVFEVLCKVDDVNDLLKEEKRYFLIKNCLDRKIGYNICENPGSTLGIIVSIETREKISKIHKGKKKSEETRKRMSDFQKTVKKSEKELERLRTLNKGRKFSEKARKNIALGSKIRKVGSENPRAKIREDIVFYIKKMIYEGWRNVDIAKVFCISHKIVSSIRKGTTWRHVIYEPSTQ